jgi:hypothetical protein
MQETNRKCEWCDHRAHMKAQVMKKKNKQLIGTAMYWYACSNHADKLDNIEYLSDKELINYESYTTRSS